MKFQLLCCCGVLASSTGCFSREVPATLPATSPASLSAVEAARAPVTRSLEGDPPLPGESTQGWRGLEANQLAAPAASSNTALTYTCPMHPEVVSPRPGKCPHCGMNLVRKP